MHLLRAALNRVLGWRSAPLPLPLPLLLPLPIQRKPTKIQVTMLHHAAPPPPHARRPAKHTHPPTFTISHEKQMRLQRSSGSVTNAVSRMRLATESSGGEDV
jgi:hypothetical protein